MRRRTHKVIEPVPCIMCKGKVPQTRAYHGIDKCPSCLRKERMPDKVTRKYAEAMAKVSFCQAGLSEEYFYNCLRKHYKTKAERVKL